MKLKSLGANKTEVQLTDIGHTVLFSYSTPVAAFIPGKGYYRTSKKWSVTTSKHITQWLDGAQAEEAPQEFFENLASA